MKDRSDDRFFDVYGLLQGYLIVPLLYSGMPKWLVIGLMEVSIVRSDEYSTH